MAAVHRYDGYVAQALGDVIFALSGAPVAQKDRPQRALYAALRMPEEMRGDSSRSLAADQILYYEHNQPENLCRLPFSKIRDCVVQLRMGKENP